MVSVEKCCVCLRLSTGGIILGSFGAFSSLLLVMVVGGFMLNYDNFVERSFEKGVGDDIESKENKKLAVFLETYKNVIVTLMTTYLVLQCFSFVASLSLVCGAINKRPKLIVAWLVSHALLTIFWAFGSLLTNDINLTLYAFVGLYFWICIYSLYKSMNLEAYQHQLNSHYGHSMQAV